MWNPWDLTLWQGLSILVFIVGFGWVMQMLLDELRRIRKELEGIRRAMGMKAPAADPLLYRDPDNE